MPKWSWGSAATIAALMLFVLPIRAQLPTIADVDRGSNAPATGPLPDWDVTLLKPHPPEDHTMMWQMSPDGVILKNLPLEQMICSAWDMKPYQVSGLSGWMKDAGFDLTTKVSADDLAAYKKLNTEQRRIMLQKLLTERFQLKFHMETKTLPVYNLVIDKSGSKLKTTTAIEAPSPEEMRANPDKYKKGSMMMGPGMYEGTGVTVRSLASQLANALSKPVNDTTGLTGLYDITLHFRPEELDADSAADPAAPSIFSAVQEQLGLKLVPTKGPVETLVLDAAQKPQAD